MMHRAEIVRQRQAAIRRELDRRGIALKAVAFDSGIKYKTLLTYFPEEGGRKPVMLPASALYSLADANAIPDDLLSLLLPSRKMILVVPEGMDHDEFETRCRDWLATKGKAHHPDSPAGRDIAPCEDKALRAARLKVVAA